MSEDMRKPAEWMSKGLDEAIMEYLRDHHWGSPETISEGVGYSKKYVQGRLKELREHELIERPARGVYTPNDNTIAYLDEELDASEL